MATQRRNTHDSESRYVDGHKIHPVNSLAVDGTHLHASEVIPRPDWYHAWEHRRPEWLQEVSGEFFGVFFYVYAGIGSTATFNVGLLTGDPTLGSLFQVGFAYAIGVAIAITVCAMSSGGHFNPAVTVAFTLFRGFPARKAPYYILAQLAGAYVAALIVYGQWRETILAIEEVLIATGKESVIFTPNGTAGIFALYVKPTAVLKWVFMNEFFADFFIGLVIWGALDPSNVFVSAASVPFLVGFAYFVVIAGYAPNGLSANPARDFGVRLMAITVWGTKAWGGTYAALAALTAIPATIAAAMVYELLLNDSSRVVTSGSREIIANADRHREHKAYKYNLRVNRMRDGAAGGSADSNENGSMHGEKPTTQNIA